jgi:hypothetical protein
MADSNNQQQQDGQQPSGEQQDEVGFGAAFAERAADPGRQASETQEDGDEPSDKDPAEAGSTEAPSDKEATDQTASGTAEEADPWAGLTPEQMRQRLTEIEAERDRLQASERSQRGRVGALTKKLNALRATAAQQPSQQEQTGEGSGGKEESDLDKRLKAIAEEYPDVVGPVAEALALVRAEVDGLKKPAATGGEADGDDELDADAEAITKELDALKKAHPDFEAVAADQNFAAWLKDQPDEYTQLVNTFDAKKVGSVLTLYKAERSAASASQSGDGGEPGKQESTATDDRRKRQLEGSRQVRGSSQPAAAGVPKDFSSAFKARAQAQAD